MNQIASPDQIKTFLNTPQVKECSDLPFWGVSDNNKRPIDVRHLYETGKARGAKHQDERCLLELDKLNTFIPIESRTNTAFGLDVLSHNFVVFDIEPTCDSVLAHKFLTTLPWKYAETSMSGKGYHLILPLPKNFGDFEVSVEKLKLQATNRQYEVLLSHWVTFTHNALDLTPPADNEISQQAWADTYAELAKQVKAVSIATSEKLSFELSEECPPIPYFSMLINLYEQFPYDKTPEHFENDMSRWEYGMLSHLSFIYVKFMDFYRFQSMGNESIYYPTLDEITWAIYEMALEIIPHRPKHDGYRAGYPFLLHQTYSIVAGKDWNRFLKPTDKSEV